MSDRFDRNEQLFGKAGQDLLRKARVTIVGVGGLGTHVVQQLALLGVGGLVLVDDQRLDESNRNRYVGVGPGDVGERKVDLGERLAKSIDPSICVDKVFASLVTVDAFEAVKQADYIFGCLDNEGARLVLTELCAAYAHPYIDAASDVVPASPPAYGGRVCVAWDGDGCAICLSVLDAKEAREDLENPEARRDRDAIYGVRRELLGHSGPSIVSVNGVVASLATTEFMVAVTGIRRPQRLLTYYGHRGTVTVSKDEVIADCYYCKGIRATGVRAGVERYLASPCPSKRCQPLSVESAGAKNNLLSLP
ncbi:MAG: ThiF family adenylyltransferase [Deltaproteobacteria bacterium]|nr:ThiF family adenylyltransferase [Deltaproteobacteria bacterium]